MDQANKDCIACAEEIKLNAVLCKHCGTRQDNGDFLAIPGQEKSLAIEKSGTSDSACGRCNSPGQHDFGTCTSCGVELPYASVPSSSFGSDEKDEALASYKKRAKPPVAGKSSGSRASSGISSRGDSSASDRKSRIAWAIVIGVIAVLAGLNGQNIIQFVTGQLTGEVTVSSSLVENSIEDGIRSDLGMEVTADCGDRIQGKPGETRQCLIEDSLGGKTIVDVTIQDASGRITWVTR